MKLVYPLARHRSQILQTNGRLYHLVPASLSVCVRQGREPLCPLRVLPFKGQRFPPPREALPPHHCSYGLMRQTKILLAASLRPLFRKVFAGCRQSLLEVGPSRLYLCNPCVGAWAPTPWYPPSALARFFPEGNGLTLKDRRSTYQMFPVMQLQQGRHLEAAVIPLCSGSHAR
jgi:hypothetical protein